MESLEARVNKLEERIKDVLVFSIQGFDHLYKDSDVLYHAIEESDPVLFKNYIRKSQKADISSPDPNFRAIANDTLIEMEKLRGASGSDPHAVSGGKRRKNKTRKSRR